MLCQFSFQNFKSYKDETTFDFRAMAIPEFQDALIRQEKAEDLLPVSAVYGPNGGGKTNLLQAFFQLLSVIIIAHFRFLFQYSGNFILIINL